MCDGACRGRPVLPDGAKHYQCPICAEPTLCELCGYDEEDGESSPPARPATIRHVDYYVCAAHLHIAVDNVSSRRW